MTRKQENSIEKIRAGISSERLCVYGARDGAPNDIVVARYLWNIGLSESLYPALQMCEVGLRNSMHRALTEFCSSERWYDSLDLTAWAQQQVGKAKTDLARHNKAISPGRVVAELSFAMWTSLLEPHYEQHVHFMPGALKRVFPMLPKSMQRRTLLKQRTDRIRKLRNRVFHHERIIHWKDLVEQHQMILQMIGWLSADLNKMTQEIDRFEQVYLAGESAYLERARRLLA